MWNNTYSEAAVEVLDILKYTNENDVNKIPKKFIEFLSQNCSKNYISTIDKNKTISEMNLKQETKDLLGIIYRNWWTTQEEKAEIYKKISEMRAEEQEKAKEIYSYDNLFKTKNNEIESPKVESKQIENMPLIKYKKSLFKSILEKLKNFFRKE